MTTYVWEIALILLVAFILGYLLRLLLNSNYKSTIEDLEHEVSLLKAKNASLELDTNETFKFETKLKDQDKEIVRLNDKLSSCYSAKLKAESGLLSAQNEVRTLKSNKSVASSQPIVASNAIRSGTNSEVSGSSSSPTSTNETGKKDDFKKIEGIGPKIQDLLYNDGIYSYPQLIAASVDRIKGILVAAGPNYAVHDPSTWGEQANLANTNQWEALETLQEKLKGGKRK